MTFVPRPVRLSIIQVLLLLASAISLHAQPALQWDKTLGGDSWDELNGLLTLPDGIIAAGSSRSGLISGNPNDLSWNFLIVKLNLDGQVLWQRVYGGDLDDRLWAIIPTSDGGFLAGGYSYSGISGDKTQPSRGDMDVWVLKLDEAGMLEWERAYGGLYRDELFDMLELPGGGYLLGCNSWSDVWMEKSEPSRGLQDFWFLRIDAQGNLLWEKTIGGSDYDQLNDLEWAPDGTVLVSGGTVSDGNTGELGPESSRGGMDFWLGKFDLNTRSLLWDHRYGGSGEDYAYALYRSPVSGRLFMGGRSGSAPSPPTVFNNGKNAPFYGGDSDYWLLELNPDGSKMQEWSFGGSGLDDLYDVKENLAGQLVIGGVSDSDISGNKTSASRGGFDYWMLALDANGNTLWQTDLGGTANDAMTRMAIRHDGAYVVGGHSESNIGFEKTENNLGVNDFWVLSFECGLSVEITPDGISSPCSEEPVVLDAAIDVCSTCTYLWSTGDTGTSIVIPPGLEGQYSISVLDESGCAAFDTLQVQFPPPPEIELDIQDTTVVYGQPVTIGLEEAPGYTYSWNTGATGGSITVFNSGIYELTVTDLNGCSAVGSARVNAIRKHAIWVPNIFSPNSDGYNDYATISANESVSEVISFQIADRWGGLCYRRDGFFPYYLTDGWDGTCNGQPAPPGVYSWLARVEFLDGSRELFEGSITIVR
ncbi:MAG: gliding motility-associated C-terminal domain-containing protein [Lewinellaceae bacterium]|nr:gliding motility-associated C-terminal domain-containing protein [Lewinellaceae bacterium]